MSSTQISHLKIPLAERVSVSDSLSTTSFHTKLRQTTSAATDTDWFRLSSEQKSMKLEVILNEALAELSNRPDRVTRVREWSDKHGVPFYTVKEYLRVSLNEDQRRTRRSWMHEDLRLKDVRKLIRHLQAEYKTMRSDRSFVPLTAIGLEKKFKLNKHLVLECIKRALPDENDRKWRSEQVLERNRWVSPENRDRVLSFVHSEIEGILQGKSVTLTPVRRVGEKLGLAYQTVNRFIATLPPAELEIYTLIKELQFRITNQRDRVFFPVFITKLYTMQRSGSLPSLDKVVESFRTWRANQRS